MHVGKRRAVVADWVGEGATTVGRTHRIIDEHPIGREQVEPALQIFPFGNRIGVTNSGHIVILHELFLSQQRGYENKWMTNSTHKKAHRCCRVTSMSPRIAALQAMFLLQRTTSGRFGSGTDI